MSHYPDETWADLARGLLPREQESPIHRHLEEGCEECGSLSAIWSTVMELSRREASYEPSDGDLRKARLLFAEHGPERSGGAEPRIAELLFDSLQSPAPAGVRSLTRATRHLSYRAGIYYVDLRIEEQSDSERASVVGQLMQAPTEGRTSLEGLTVTLSSGQSSLASTTTNQLGEFHLEMDTRKDHDIAVGIGEEFAVVVPVRGRRGRA